MIRPGGSDTACLDNAVELLTLAGRELPHVMAMLIPEAWDADTTMPDDKRAFYEYHASLMEPWDGPAAVAFTDGKWLGATLDRNGLRPARYLVTTSNELILASETGVLPIKPEEVAYKGRLQPGRMLLVNLEEHRIVPDEEIKHMLASRQPYGEWLKENQITLEQLPQPPRVYGFDPETVLHAAAGVRLQRRRPEDDSGADGRPTAKSRWDRWASTRRWRACRTGRSRCSTTSSSCSRR